MYLPLVLNVEALIAAVDTGIVFHTVFPDVIAVGASLVYKRATRESFTPVLVEPTVRIVIVNIVGNTVHAPTAFQRVLLAEQARNVRSIEVHVVARRYVLQHHERIADVLETSGPGNISRHCRPNIART